MCTSNTAYNTEKFGANPANVQWSVVRGDTAIIKIEFLEDDEVTYFDTTGWTYSSTAYDRNGDVLDKLTVTSHSGYVEITASPEITTRWGEDKYLNVVAELPFDLEVKIPQEPYAKKWTPVIGTIRVMGDISPGGCL